MIRLMELAEKTASLESIEKASPEGIEEYGQRDACEILHASDWHSSS
jgi:hypothetical protein